MRGEKLLSPNDQSYVDQKRSEPMSIKSEGVASRPSKIPDFGIIRRQSLMAEEVKKGKIRMDWFQQNKGD